MCQTCASFDPFMKGCIADLPAVDHVSHDTGSENINNTVSGAGARAASSTQELTFGEIATHLNFGGWGNRSYSWDVGPSGIITVNLDGLTAGGKTLARTAMEAWENVVGLNFVEVAGTAQITFQDHSAGAWASFSAASGNIVSATVNVSTSWLATYGTQLNGYGFQTYIHEIGHAIGLAHAGFYNGSATYGVDNHYANDSWQQSIMSYFHQNENTHVDASFAWVITPQIADILAAQWLYGVAGNLRTGNTVYGNNSTAGGYWDQFGTLRNVSFTILDDGGTDTLDTSDFAGPQRADLRAERFSDLFGEEGNVGIARGTLIENYNGGSGRDHVTGNDADNTIYANDGQDEVYAGAGNDLVFGGQRADRLVGNAGDDTLHGEDGDDILKGKDGNNLIYGDAGADRIEGANTGADTLYGGDDADTITGLSGADQIFGEGGADRLYGGAGEDTLDGGTEDDLLKGNGDDDLLRGDAGADRLYGGDGQDTLFGGDGSDRLQGNADADSLHGEEGNDFLYGGSGEDTLFGGADNDLLRGNGAADLLYGDAGSDSLYGGNAGDTLSGGADRDFLRGENGADRLIGGTGDDNLHGGAGADIFVYATGFRFDRVLDFEDGIDLLDISGTGVSGFGDLRFEARASDMRINFGGGDVLYVLDTGLAVFGADDFIFA